MSSSPVAPQGAVTLQPGDLVDEREAAAILCAAVRTLRNLRSLDKGPAFHKIGQRLVRYRRADLVAFIAASSGAGP